MAITAHAKVEARFNIAAKLDHCEGMSPVYKRALALILQEAEEARKAATVAGSWTDGGANVLQKQAADYIAGWMQDKPDWLIPYVEQAEMEADAEFETYKRLYDKFNGAKPSYYSPPPSVVLASVGEGMKDFA